MKQTGLIHLYYGDGKGKTTAAMGLAIRCCGSGGRVFIVQFLKGDNSGERKVLETIPNISLQKGYEGIKFNKYMNEKEKEHVKQYYRKQLNIIRDIIQKQELQLLILDEIIDTVNLNFLEEKEIIRFLKNKPQSLEVVMTGRNPKESFVELADYVSNMQKIKHPFDNGITARKGIEM